MNSQEFVIWLKGFTEGVHEYNITPKQWDLLKDKLAKVDDNIITMGGVIVDHNTFKVNDHGFYQIQPYKHGTSAAPNGIITTTPGNTSITYTTGSGLGAGVTYTTNGTPNWYTVNKTENDSTDK